MSVSTDNNTAHTIVPLNNAAVSAAPMKNAAVSAVPIMNNPSPFQQAMMYIELHIDAVLKSSKAPELDVGFKQLRGLLDKVIEAHPRRCMICEEHLVPEEERLCRCAYLSCLKCVGRAARPNCAGCNVDFDREKLAKLISDEKLLMSLPMICTKDFAAFKPEIVALRMEHRKFLQHQQEQADEELAASSNFVEEENGEIVDLDQASPEAIEEQERELARLAAVERRRRLRERSPVRMEELLAEDEPITARTRAEERKEREEKYQEREEPVEEEESERDARRREKRDRRPNKEEQEMEMAAQIQGLLRFCAERNDQRTWPELMAALETSHSWAQQHIDTRPAHAMDAKTVQAQWFVMASLSQQSVEMRFLSRLRMGELFDRLSDFSRAGTLTGVDRHGNQMHYTSAHDYLRHEFKYSAHDEANFRACHQFFLVWKEYHPIIDISKTQVTWTWLQQALTCSKLLNAMREFKELPPPLSDAIAPMTSITVPEELLDDAPALFHRTKVRKQTD